MSTLLDVSFWSFVGAVAGIFAIFALGVQIQGGYAGVLNFGHVGFMAIAAYAMAILVVRAGMGIWLASLVAVALAVVAAVLLGLTSRRLPGDKVAIWTLAFGEIVRLVATNADGLTGGTQGSINLLGPGHAASYNTGWIAFQARIEDWLASALGGWVTREFTMLVVVWTVTLVLLVVLDRPLRSPWGRTLRSLRDDQDAAAALGTSPLRYRVQVLALGSALAAVAGLLFAFQFSFFSPRDFEPLVTFFAWMIVVLGGLGRLWAVPVGAVAFSLIFTGTRFLDVPPLTLLGPGQRASVRMILIGLILIALVAARPQGLLGRREETILD